ncbi:MAG: FAD-dependent oxidoreductase [Asticcacaulis sp.]
MRIAIVGAGIGGLACALLLSQKPFEITVFDQFETPSPVGSGLVIQPVGLWVLDQLGLGDLVRSRGATLSRIYGTCARTGRPVLDVHYGPSESLKSGLGLHRAALFDALYRAAQAVTPDWRTGQRVVSQERGILTLSDGTVTEPFDLVIDASGAASALSPLKGKPLTYGAVWGTVDWVDGPMPVDQLSQCYRRADRMIGILPVGLLPGDAKPKAALFWLLRADGYEAWRKAGLRVWRDEAVGLWPALAPFIDQITDPAQMTLARYTHGTLSKPWSKGLVHIGDAAHRTSPQLGQGANMALLDAFSLWRAIQALQPGTPIEAALQAYAHERRGHVWAYQTISAMFTPAYQSDSRILPPLRDHILYPFSRIPPMPWLLSRMVRGDLVSPLSGMD